MWSRPLFALLVVSACTQFPELEATRTPGVVDEPYPTLIPTDPLLIAPEPNATPDVIKTLDQRVAALRARANQLRREQVGPRGVAQRVARLRKRMAELQAQ